MFHCTIDFKKKKKREATCSIYFEYCVLYFCSLYFPDEQFRNNVMWNTYCKFAVNDIKNTIFILVLSHWMISLFLPGWLAGLVLWLFQKVLSLSKNRVESSGWRFRWWCWKFARNDSGGECVLCVCSAFRGEVQWSSGCGREGKAGFGGKWSLMNRERKERTRTS